MARMDLNARNTAMWSKLGSRATYGLAVAEIGKTVDDMMVLTGDTSTSAGLDRFKKAFPEKFLDVGIAEQNMIGIAAGIASEGTHVITATFAPFQTMRCCEQIRVNLGYMNHKICMVGLASGVVLGTLGYTHCCIEDMAVMRAIPNIAVVSPADCGATVKAASAALEHDTSVYLRLTGGSNNPPVYEDDFPFEIGKAVTLREGADVAIIAAGTMVHRALQAAELLSGQGIDAGVIDMHTIKPIDADLIEKLCGAVKLLVSVEEHSTMGGLGSAVAEVAARLNSAPPQLFLGLPAAYGMSGAYEDILNHYGLTDTGIASDISERMQRL